MKRMSLKPIGQLIVWPEIVQWR